MYIPDEPKNNCPCSFQLIRNYFSTMKHYFLLTTFKHKPNFSEFFFLATVLASTKKKIKNLRSGMQAFAVMATIRCDGMTWSL